MGGQGFGNLAKIRGVVYFRLSPYEMSVFKGLFSHSVPNIIRRFNSNVLRVAPPFLFTALLMRWANDYNYQLNRKDPKQYENDV